MNNFMYLLFGMITVQDNIDFEDYTDEEVMACILKMAANRYRDRRCRLHKYCNELQAKGIDPVTQPYRNWAGSSDDWRWLCEHFGTEAFQVCLGFQVF